MSRHLIYTTTLLFLIGIVCPQSLTALVIQEEFSSATQNNTAQSTAVWNLVGQKLHVPIIIDRDPAGGGETEDDTVELGTGADGAFSPSTYSTFDNDAPLTPNTITLDTSRVYNFTTFDLQNGYTLTGTTDAPLEIRVQGAAIIDGIIDLRGEDGQNVVFGTGTSPAGGTACCGGGAGGAGGSDGIDGTDGTGGDVGNTGRGRGGVANGTDVLGNGSGGGGGGGFSDDTLATAGETKPGGGTGGAAGSSYSDDWISPLAGGSGGGGGGGYDQNQGGLACGGAGGGGGGGALKLTTGGSIDISATGQILLTGGNGGQHIGGDPYCGSGGGGSGGAILILAGGSISHAGTMDAQKGSGGTNGNGGIGGDGAAGRTRIEDNAIAFSGAGPLVPNQQSLTIGQSFYSKSSVIIESNSYDTGTENPVYISMGAVDNGTPTITYEVAGSSDDFNADDTGWISSNSLSQLNGKRYFKFKVTLQSADRTQSPEVSRITMNIFDQGFEFSMASCGGVHRSGGNYRYGILNLLFFGFLLLLPSLTRRWPLLRAQLEKNQK